MSEPTHRITYPWDSLRESESHEPDSDALWDPDALWGTIWSREEIERAVDHVAWMKWINAQLTTLEESRKPPDPFTRANSRLQLTYWFHMLRPLELEAMRAVMVAAIEEAVAAYAKEFSQ